MATTGANSSANLLHKLCCHLSGASGDAVTPYYQFVLQILARYSGCAATDDEFYFAEKIKKKLSKERREKDIALFVELHRKLQSSSVLSRRWSVLCLLLNLQDEAKKIKAKSIFARGLSALVTSTPFSFSKDNFGSSKTRDHRHHPLGLTLGTIHPSPSDPTPLPLTYISPVSPDAQCQGDIFDTKRTAGSRLIALAEQKQVPEKVNGKYHKNIRPLTDSVDNYPTTNDVCESVLLRELIYIFQGIEGKIMRIETGKDGFRIDPKVGISKPMRTTVLRLAELGWLHNRVKRFHDSKLADRGLGLVGQSFVAALNQELAEYYRLLAVLEAQAILCLRKAFKRHYAETAGDIELASLKKLAVLLGLGICHRKLIEECGEHELQYESSQLHSLLLMQWTGYKLFEAWMLQQEDDPNLNLGQSGLTLRRLQLWTFDPLFRLQILAALVDVCKGLKGGALASAVYSYLQHGDPSVRGILRNVLAMMAVPIYTMLDRWIFDGELEDHYREFFVAADPMVLNEKLWHEKYSLRKSMVPSFISMSQAKKILSTGKSINFLRQVCHDPTPLQGRDAIRGSLESSSLESIFTQDQEGDLQNIIDTAYKETSRRLIDIMQTKYKFMDHLKAMRRYLLLGQGDFIRHLMDILEGDLSKPAGQLYRHNLSGSMESAIRATNAQFDDPDILRRLDVRLLEVSPGDYGWDVFSLDYHVDGPIGTVFTPSVMTTYLRLFNALWRAKRMEYVLSNVWKSQMTHSRLLRAIPDLNPVLHQCYTLASEMFHFIQQIQYYITFEVMECSWDVLEKKVKAADDLDQIIAAHDEFLETIMARALLDEESKELLTQLRTIYDLIIQLQTIQECLCLRALQEVERIHTSKSRIERNAELGKWGTDELTVDAEKQRFQELLKNVIPTTRAQLRILSQSYQDMVQKFLLMLTSHRDVSLQFLSFRLDFNEHYKNRDSRLRTHLTYQHRRQSSIRIANKSASFG